ncbi:MAG: IS66 family insertion sequence element accessory protein TnpB [Bacteroidaceae bacterium]|jgi:hypothetical protein|nr:IS66 family insertion sequence element accessory protein TnpB [Bacteroidaceae bacterium]
MIRLSGEFRYYLCIENVTLRYRHRGLREYIRGKLHRDPGNGDVFIFLSRDLSRLRVYYFHHGGEILTEKILRGSRFTHPIFLDKGKNVYHISWSSFVYLLEGVIRKGKDEFFEEEYDDARCGKRDENAV